MGSDTNKIIKARKNITSRKKMRSDWHRNFLNAALHTLNAWLNILVKILQIMMFAGLTTYLWIGVRREENEERN